MTGIPSASNSPPARTSTSIVRVRYAETDKMGVVYYAHYFVWLEIGRTEWLRDAGWTYRAMEEQGIGLPVIEARCEYKRGARYDDEIEIHTCGRLVSPIRLTFDYQLLRRSDGAPMAVGHTVHVAVDRAGRPVRLPVRVRELLA